MDNRHLKAHLYDISTAIDEVQSFFEQVPRRFDEYSKNLMLRRADERNIGIIGEAVNKILQIAHDFIINDLRFLTLLILTRSPDVRV